jgi:serine protease AprX
MPPAPPQSQPLIKGDADANKLFDDLEADLAGRNADARVRVIVALRAAATEGGVHELERRVGALAGARRFGIVPAFSATVTNRQARALAREEGVAHVEADSRVRASNGTSADAFGVTAARIAVAGLDGSGVKVAVIDTGVAGAHADLTGKVTAFHDYVGGQSAAYDDHGHGTHVAATIVGSGAGNPAYAGVAPGASLLAAKVLDANGDGWMSDITAAIDWAVNQGADVMNLSLGESGCSDGSDVTSQAVDNAAARGVFVAVAAGNEGPGACTIGTPGAAKGATTVGAMADLVNGGFFLARFSSRGRPGAAGSALKPDVVAPGVNVMSANAFTPSGYRFMSGTSMATPFVAGVAALMLDAGFLAADLKPTMESTAVDWGAAGDDIEFGSGRLDAFRAITGGADRTPLPRHSFRQGSLPGTGANVEYQITVDDGRFPLTAMVVHPEVSGASATSPDFDLHLLNGAGTEIAAGNTTSRQERLTVTPVSAGTYTLQIRSYEGSGAFQLDISAGGTIASPGSQVSTTPVSAISVFRPSNGTWYTNDTAVSFGASGDIPVAGDYDGNGAGDVAVFRPSDGIWYHQGRAPVAFGTAGDVPVPADFEGESTVERAVFRPSTGIWYFQAAPAVAFGTSGDIPVPGDYDENGTTERAVFRPSNGVWYLQNGSAVPFGTSGDWPVPLPAALGSMFFPA